MYYFYQTIIERGRNRLRALPGQRFLGGLPINTSLNVKTSAGLKHLREDLPIGTIFVSESCLCIQESGRTKFYDAKDIFPVYKWDEAYSPTLPLLTPDMEKAFGSYLVRSGYDVSIKPYVVSMEQQYRFVANGYCIGIIKPSGGQWMLAPYVEAKGTYHGDKEFCFEKMTMLISKQSQPI